MNWNGQLHRSAKDSTPEREEKRFKKNNKLRDAERREEKEQYYARRMMAGGPGALFRKRKGREAKCRSRLLEQLGSGKRPRLNAGNSWTRLFLSRNFFEGPRVHVSKRSKSEELV